MCICVTPPGQTKNDTDLKFGTHWPYLKLFFFCFFGKISVTGTFLEKLPCHVDFPHISSIVLFWHIFLNWRSFCTLSILQSWWVFEVVSSNSFGHYNVSRLHQDIEIGSKKCQINKNKSFLRKMKNCNWYLYQLLL